MAKKHFMIYYQKGTGTFVITEPRPWARENRNLFGGLNFDDNHPTPNFIEKKLVDEFKFIREIYEEENVVVTYNLNPNLDFQNTED